MLSLMVVISGPLRPAAAVEAPAKPAEQLLGAAARALGGSEALGRLRSLSVAAECTGPDGPFRTWIQSLRPDQVHFRQIAADHTTEIWSTPLKTWAMTSAGAWREIGPQMRGFVRGHEFHLLLFELESRFHNHRGGEADSVHGQKCDRILMQDETDQPASVCLAVEDGLPLELELNPPGAEGAVRVRFGDWDSIDGLRYFRSFTLTEGAERTFTYKYVSISPNQVTEEPFRIPAQLETGQTQTQGG